jgi:tetratricopeptide (TPR) repeat protein
MAAKAYKAEHFAEAQQHSERALSLDPSNRTAHFFLARIIHQQYKPGVGSPENIARARSAIAAYQAILIFDQQNDEAYKAIAFLYASIHDDSHFRDWIFKRASNPAFANEKRAEAYATLAGKDWDCSFRITELPDVKLINLKRKNPVVVFRKPKDESDFEKAKQCVTSGLEMVDLAIALNPESEAAWSYKTNLFLEAAHLAEMGRQVKSKAAYLKAAKRAEAEALRLSEKRRRETRPEPDNIKSESSWRLNSGLLTLVKTPPYHLL